MTWEYIGGEKLWQNHKNDQTGEESIKEHKLKVVKQWCAKELHKFIIQDMNKRLSVCSECGQEYNFVEGRDIIDGNRILLKKHNSQ